ncbi:MAG: 5-(carboxyamino)imidazole ribonucleotide synthase [Bdellovibrionales bacterium]|nr:5-(carboxyamino)imidazole ribonucleotide synthase [Bdellovibrionales bacterium]
MKPIGILGGGQLARMLVLEAYARGLPTTVLSQNPMDPAAQVANDWIEGSPDRVEDVVKLLKRCSAVTFESEFYLASILEAAAKATGVAIWPKPQTMDLLRDRLSQKRLFDQHKLATAPWLSVSTKSEAESAFLKFGGAVVFKARTGGYDGYGTTVVRNERELKSFVAEIEKQTGSPGFIGERLIPFERELAMILARDQSGNIIEFPLVESKQVDSRCLWVAGPAGVAKKSKASNEKMKLRLKKFLKSVDYVGAMGVEFFEVDGEILINEIAPRVHNTGHYTQAAMSFNQFTAHLFAVGGLKLEKPVLRAPNFAMWNLLGSTKPLSTYLTPWLQELPEKPVIQTTVHWYGKHETRPGRKLGHINLLATAKSVSQSALLKAAKSSATSLAKKTGY